MGMVVYTLFHHSNMNKLFLDITFSHGRLHPHIRDILITKITRSRFHKAIVSIRLVQINTNCVFALKLFSFHKKDAYLAFIYVLNSPLKKFSCF